MAELIGVEKLNKVIKGFFDSLGYDEIEVFMSNEFAYYQDDEEVSYTIIEDTDCDKGYQVYLSERFTEVPKISAFVFSLLHELGHHITLPLIKSKKQRLKVKKTKKIFERQCAKAAKSPEDYVNWQVRYCKLFDERIATEKAVQILLQNYKLITKYEKKIYKALAEFYKNNNLEAIFSA